MAGNNVIDYLTKMYNRKGLYEKFAKISGKDDIHFMFLDLDNFKTVNDVYSHKAGDELLCVTGMLLQECAPEAIAARLGGDEFVVMFCGTKSREELAGTAEKILGEMRRKGREMEFFTVVSMSIGIVWKAPCDTDLDLLLSQSDAAMYEAKQNGKSCYIFYNDLEEKFLREKEMEENAEQALKDGQFEILYQPVYHMQSSRLERTQVCIVWNRDEKTIWKSGDFRPLLERSGFMKEVDLYAFETVCRNLSYFGKKEPGRNRISIQLSRRLFLDENLGGRLQEIMRRYEVDAEEIELEIEERAFNSRGVDKLIDSMKKLKDRGFSLAMIHFGTDFSSFRYLRVLPIDSLKFEESYIKENSKNNRGRQIIKTLIKLGKDLKFLLVAQGIVEKEEVVFLSSCGCDAAAGEFYRQPQTFGAYREYVRTQAAHKEESIVFDFKDSLEDSEHEITGEIIGSGVMFVPGISEMRGGLYFPGGEVGKNLVCYPGSLFSGNSYTFALWMKPEAAFAWTSVIYMRYLEGFASLVPSLGGGQSIYRISEDIDVNNGWHDTFCRAAALHKWCFVAITYDSFSESICYYLNGRKAGYRVDVPTMISCRQVLLGGDPFQKSYQGYVSALTVYDSVKTDEEIRLLYSSYFEEPGFCGEKEDFWMEIN